MKRLAIILAVVIVSKAVATELEWGRFRGPNGSGIAVGQRLVDDFDKDKNVVWRIKVDAGTSSPIIVGDRLFYSSYRDNQRSLNCIDSATGNSIWSKHVVKRHEEVGTSPYNPATPTPACDGKYVSVHFPDYGIATYSVSGDLVWEQHYPPSTSMHGLSSSLVITDGKVVHLVDQLTDSYIAAFDVETGELAWKVERISGITGAYSTPVVYQPKNGAKQVIVSGPIDLAGYDLESGEKTWWITGVTNAPISTPLLIGDTVFCSEPLGEPIDFSQFHEMDKDKDGKVSLDETKDLVAVQRLVRRIDEARGNGDGAVDAEEVNAAFGVFAGRGGLVAIDATGSGDVTESHVKWTHQKSVPHIPCPAICNGCIFLVSDGGIVTSVDAETGEVGKRARLSKATGTYYASPVVSDGRVYLANTKGDITVLDAKKDWEVIATNSIEEACFATPAISNNRLFVRTEEAIYCFGN